ncbi:MAG: phage baseplate protein [Pyrinomonadaceae bacterium]
MHALSASKLLSVWEQAVGQPPVARSLALLAAAFPEQTPEELAHLSIGRRDRLLLALREQTFGSRLVCRTPCQRCCEPLELTFNVADIRAPTAAATTAEALTLQAGDYEVLFRLPNSLDLSALADCRDVAAGELLLLARCLLHVSADGQARAAEELPGDVREAVVRHMAEADPQADVQLTLACPACGHRWLAAFDIVSYFWSEINAWAQRILREVHTLAAAYGWREEDILAMSPPRRHIYLEMVGG